MRVPAGLLISWGLETLARRIKQLKIGEKVGCLDVAGDPDRMARFEREARVLASLNHPHIVGAGAT